MKTPLLVSLCALAFVGCVPPPSDPAKPVSEPSPADPSGIPWAAGEGPGEAREVPFEEPREAEAIDPGTDAAIVQSTPGNLCTGKGTPALRSAVDVRGLETKKCYDELPPGHPDTKGKLRLSVRVEGNGAVQRVETLEDTVGVPAVTACVEKVYRAPFAEKPRGGCTVFVIPLEMSSKEVITRPAEETEPAAAAPAEGTAAPVEGTAAPAEGTATENAAPPQQ